MHGISVPEIQINTAEGAIRDWLVIGPFNTSKDVDPLNMDFLRKKQIEEASCDSISFAQRALEFSRDHASTEQSIKLYSLADQQFLDFQYIFGRRYDIDAAPSAAYAACEIESDKLIQAYLLIASAEDERIWLNGKLLETTAGRHNLNPYREALPMELRSGHNFLLIKVVRWNSPSWGMTARIATTPEAATAIALEAQNAIHSSLLKRAVIKRGQALVFAPRGVPVGIHLATTITDFDGNVIAAPTLDCGRGLNHWKLSDETPEGIYKLQIQFEGRTFYESFCFGDMQRIAEQLIKQLARLDLDDQTAIDFNGLVRRLKILLHPENVTNAENEREIEDKFVYTASELEGAIRRQEKGKNAFKGVPGLHLRGFRSSIDDSLQYYRIFIPKVRDQGGLGIPLAVMEPTATSSNRPFIESVFIARQAEAERLSAVAANYGMGILWCGYRTQPTGAPCEFTNFDEALAAVERDYHIDPHRIYLLGACSGCAIETMTAVRWPQRFAAIGMLNPTFHLSKNLTSDEINIFHTLPAFQEWLNHTNEVSTFLHLAELPTYIVDEGAEPGHGEPINTIEFMRSAKKEGFLVKVKAMPETSENELGGWDELLRWMASKKRPNCSDQHDERFFASSGKSGPIATAFASRFVVVEGTEGSAADTEQITDFVTRFQREWKRSQFVSCRVVPDFMLDKKDAFSSNLILIGNTKTNSVWRRITSDLPIDVKPNLLRLHQNVWQGTSLVFQAIFMDAAHSQRRIVLIGGDKLENLKYCLTALATDGWFDYAVWGSAPDHGGQLIAAGKW